MKILVTGTGRCGSWEIRGKQLGEAMGANVIPNASQRECTQADMIILVKRTSLDTLGHIKRSGKPWVWDVVDAWPQRPGQELSKTFAMKWVAELLEYYNPTGVVWPTLKMANDVDWANGPSTVLPHHYNPRYRAEKMRDIPSVVAYEGCERYLGKWRSIIDQEAVRQGMQFIVNDVLERADVGVAVRDTLSYPDLNWKSNVKLANLHALGIPALCTRESGYVETQSGTEFWVRDANDIAHALETVRSVDTRKWIRQSSLRQKIPLKSIAATYARFLRALVQ